MGGRHLGPDCRPRRQRGGLPARLRVPQGDTERALFSQSHESPKKSLGMSPKGSLTGQSPPLAGRCGVTALVGLLRVPVATVRKWNHERSGPAFMKIGAPVPGRPPSGWGQGRSLWRGRGGWSVVPNRVLPAQATELRLDFRGHLVWAAGRLGAAVREGGHAVAGVAAQPVVQGLACHAVAAGDAGDRCPGHHLEHCLVALLQHPQLHEHGRPPSAVGRGRRPPKGREEPTSSTLRCQAGTGAGVAQEAELCRPGTEPASKECRVPTEPDVESMYRTRTGVLLNGPRDFRGTSKPLEAPPSMEKLASELPIRLWAHEDLNLGPLPCQGSALPLSYAPFAPMGTTGEGEYSPEGTGDGAAARPVKREQLVFLGTHKASRFTTSTLAPTPSGPAVSNGRRSPGRPPHRAQVSVARGQTTAARHQPVRVQPGSQGR
jgi:hypothetical protein